MDAECKRARRRAYYLANKERSVELAKIWYEANKARAAANSLAWREANKEKAAAIDVAWRKANKEKVRLKAAAWRRANPDKAKACETAWREANPAAVNAKNARRRTRILNATPPWVDHAAIRQVYDLAALLGMHVDHIHPLKGKNFCGLHVPWNLQLLTASQNRRKSNKLEV